jgi:DNA polymerase III subunit delta'
MRRSLSDIGHETVQVESFIGHQRQMDMLMSGIQADTLSHALLVTGPVHIGKTTLALACASRVLSQQFSVRTSLDGWRDKASSRIHPDLLFVAPQPSIGIDQVRELKTFLQLTPHSSSRKICIIDDADRLTIQAQHALLKLLEEPPAHSLIMLVSAYPGRLLPTIHSRCMQVAMQQVLFEDLVSHVGDMDIDEDQLREWYAFFGGRPGLYVNEDREVLAAFYRKAFDDFCRLGDLPAYARLLLAQDYGLDRQTARRFIDYWLVLVRDSLLLVSGHQDLLVHQAFRDTLVSIVDGLSRSRLVSMRNALLAARRDLADSVSARFVLENYLLSV